MNSPNTRLVALVTMISVVLLVSGCGVAVKAARLGARAGVRSVDDVARAGVGSADDVARAGVRSVDDVARAGVRSADDAARAAGDSADDAALAVGRSGDDLGRNGRPAAYDLDRGVGAEGDDAIHLGPRVDEGAAPTASRPSGLGEAVDVVFEIADAVHGRASALRRRRPHGRSVEPSV